MKQINNTTNKQKFINLILQSFWQNCNIRNIFKVFFYLLIK